MSPVRIVMPIVFDTNIGQVQLEGTGTAAMTVEYHILGEQLPGEDDSTGFNFNKSRGFFKHFLFRQNAIETDGENDSSFLARIGPAVGTAGVISKGVETWASYLGEERFKFAPPSVGDAAKLEVVITNTRNGMLGDLTKIGGGGNDGRFVSMGRAGVHMVSDCIFGTPLALAALANEHDIATQIETSFSTALDEFFAGNPADQDNWMQNPDSTTPETYQRYNENSGQHKAMSYVYDQLRAQAPERFNQTWVNNHSDNTRTYTDVLQNDPGKYDPFDAYEAFPFDAGDNFVMFMRPRVTNMENLGFGVSYDFATADTSSAVGDGNTLLGELTTGIYNTNYPLDGTTVYARANKYLVDLHDNAQVTDSTVSPGEDGDNKVDGMIMAIQLYVQTASLMSINGGFDSNDAY